MHQTEVYYRSNTVRRAKLGFIQAANLLHRDVSSTILTPWLGARRRSRRGATLTATTVLPGAPLERTEEARMTTVSTSSGRLRRPKISLK